MRSTIIRQAGENDQATADVAMIARSIDIGRSDEPVVGLCNADKK